MTPQPQALPRPCRNTVYSRRFTRLRVYFDSTFVFALASLGFQFGVSCDNGKQCYPFATINELSTSLISFTCHSKGPGSVQESPVYQTQMQTYCIMRSKKVVPGVYRHTLKR